MRSLGLGLLFTLNAACALPQRAPIPVPAKVIKTHYGTLHRLQPATEIGARRGLRVITLPSVKQVTEQRINDL
jgi:hypothetical protein